MAVIGLSEDTPMWQISGLYEDNPITSNISNIHYLCFRQPRCKETNYLEEIDDGPKRYDVVSNM